MQKRKINPNNLGESNFYGIGQKCRIIRPENNKKNSEAANAQAK
jgi:hypothetical protein